MTIDEISKVYTKVINSNFLRIGNGVFCDFGRNPRRKIENWIRQDDQMWRVENLWNHFHWDKVLVSDRIDNYLHNRLFALATKTIWTLKLNKHRDLNYYCEVIDELTQIESDSNLFYYEIYPTIRLWTSTDAANPLEQLYAPNDGDVIFDCDKLQFVPRAVALEAVRSTAHICLATA